MYIVNEEDKEYRFGDSGSKYLMKGPRMNFALVQFQAGQDFKAHYHNVMEENFYILEGEVDIVVDGVVNHLRPGPDDPHRAGRDSLCRQQLRRADEDDFHPRALHEPGQGGRGELHVLRGDVGKRWGVAPNPTKNLRFLDFPPFDCYAIKEEK